MSLVVLGASSNIARTAQSLSEPIVFVQQSAGQLEEAIRDGLDELFTVDFRDPTTLPALVEQTLRPRRPKAVVSVIEAGLEPAAVLSEMLGTPGTPVAVVRAMRDKLMMRTTLASSAPHLNVDFADATDRAAAEALFSQHNRVVMKPATGTASERVRMLSSVEELRSYPDGDGFVLEGYADGVEYSVETFSQDGRHETIAIVLQEKSERNAFVEVSHFLPPVDLTPRQAELITESVGALLDALGLRNGPTHTEVKVSGESVRIIETHNRPAGDGLAGLVATTTAIDWRRASVGWPLGIKPTRGVPSAPAAAITFFTAPPGRVIRTMKPREHFDGATVDRWALDVGVGDVVNELRSSSDRIGWAVVSGQSAEACHRAVQALRAEPVVITAAAPEVGEATPLN